VFLTSNGAISWQSRKQSLIAMSTLKAECIACSRHSQLLLRKHRRKCGRYTHESNGFMVIGGQLEVNWRSIGGQFKVVGIQISLFMDGHPQATVILFPCSLITQCFKEATMGITICLFVCLFVCLFSCSTERSKRGECCIYGSPP
jgi:hypothetical protein